ncbi:hypothetical protein PPBDW_II0178 [Photobacterium kishitanii]|nr:hypothetical protein PPBDW_II0178 [Photobacterium kishitanii]
MNIIKATVTVAFFMATIWRHYLLINTLQSCTEKKFVQL